MERLYIFLPVHNRKETTRQVVQCLRQQTFQNFHLILLDDGSTDGTSEMVSSLLPSVTVIRGTGSWWWAGALQEGYRWLQESSAEPSDFVFILNDDNMFDTTFLENALALLQTRPRTLLASKVYGKRSGALFDGGIFADWKRWKFVLQPVGEQINCLSTRALFTRVSDFLEIGGFFPKLLPHYCSDYEFTIRAHKKNFSLLVDDRIRTVVDEKATG